MNYKNHYDLLIQRAQNRKPPEYSEVHHIIPKCMGGTNSQSNLVRLSPEEHYVAHQLLVKLYPDNDKLKYAAAMMSVGRKTNKYYGWIKRMVVEEASKRTGDKNGSYNSFWVNDGITSRRIKGNVPDGWTLGRIIKPINKCPSCGIRINSKSNFCKIHRGTGQITDEIANEILQKFLAGEKVANLYVQYGFKHDKSLITFLSRRFPDRKRHSPREIRRLSSMEE